MANNESFPQDEMQNSTSFNDWCVNSNFQEINNINQLKVDNFNLRLKCYNLDRKLSNCRCSMSNNDGSVSNADINDKLNQYLDSQKDLKDKNSILTEENRHLKEKLNYFQLKESQIVDFESIKYKYEELDKMITQQLPMGESLIGLMKTNDELIKSNVALKHRIFRLESNVTNARKECLQSHDESRKSISNLNQYQSKLIKEFNDSLELSKNISVGCFQCDALKVNYDHLYEMFMKEIENHEMLSSTLKTQKNINFELERQIELLKSEPDVNKERAKRYKKMLQDSLLKVVKKDREKKEIKEETKQLVDYYMKQIGELHRKSISQSDLCKEDLIEQHNTMKTLSTMLFDLIRKFSLHDKSYLVDELSELMITKVIKNVESEYPKLKEKWSLIVNSMRVLYEHSIEQNASKSSSQEEHSSINLSENFRQDVSMKNILTKFQELKELSNSFKETSNHFSESQRGINLAHVNMNPNSDSAIYSPQYKVNRNLLRSTENNDHFESICLANISLDATAYQSVTGDHSFLDVLASSGFENMLRKIEELGDIIHQYSDLVKKVKFHEESPEMVDKGCSALIVENNRINDSQDLNLLHSELVEEESKSKDLSFLKTLYHREKEEFENLISEKLKVIENLNMELEELKRKYVENISVLNSELEGVNLRYKLSETRIKELEGVIIRITEQKEIDQNCITDLKSKIKELEEVIIVEKNNRIEMEEMKLQLVDSVNRADLLENKLIQTKNQILQSEKIIDNLKSSNSELSDKVDQLNGNNRILINEKCKLQSDYNDCVVSLANLTESLGIAYEKIDTISVKVREMFVKFVKKDNINDVEELENCETLDILDGFETYLCDLSMESPSVSDNDLDDCIKTLVSKENDYYKTGIERRKELEQISEDSNQPISKITSLNDLTNITSLNTEISNQIMNTDYSHQLAGFKLKSLKDVVDNPDKVVLLLRSLLKTIEDLKRRLKKRYEENDRMKRMISTSYYSNTICDTLTKRVDQLKVECASNNEDIEKVIKRSSLKQ